jgi:hypothetical protein
MILWGNIREFPLFGILQFLAAQRKTGVLEIQDFEEYGCIYLTNGRIDAISLPSSEETLGMRLVAEGALTEAQVKDCWMSCTEGDVTEPVTGVLLREAKADREFLVEIVTRHTADQLMQLMYWNSGTFRLSMPDRPIVFDVVPTADIEGLLLEAYRRVDEGERPRREKVLVEEELCLTCTIECNESIKTRYLKQDVCLWRNMPSILRDPVFRTMKRRSSVVEEDDADDLSFI